MDRNAESKPKSKPRLSIVILAVIGILIAFLTIRSNQRREEREALAKDMAEYGQQLAEETAPKDEEKTKQGVFLIARDFVKHQLKAPLTARFNSYHAEESYVDMTNDSTYVVSSFVDAQNTYGTMIRKYYHCTIVMRWDGSAEVVKLKYDR